MMLFKETINLSMAFFSHLNFLENRLPIRIVNILDLIVIFDNLYYKPLIVNGIIYTADFDNIFIS